VLIHGAWADGSSWAEVIPRLQAAGLKVTAVQNPLTTLADSVAATRRALVLQDGPTVLVAHSWGGTVPQRSRDRPQGHGACLCRGKGTRCLGRFRRPFREVSYWASEEMLLTGDVVVNSAVSFLHPEWPFGFDMDEPLAIKTCMAFLDRAVADKDAGRRLPSKVSSSAGGCAAGRDGRALFALARLGAPAGCLVMGAANIHKPCTAAASAGPYPKGARAPVYDRFTEGFETSDLMAAKGLLDQLG
jgi:hypothetical protein